jgi:hypothetical protein
VAPDPLQFEYVSIPSAQELRLAISLANIRQNLTRLSPGIVRLAGGPVLIAFEQNPSIGLYVAAVILLNVGVVPLIIATLGYVRIV